MNIKRVLLAVAMIAMISAVFIVPVLADDDTDSSLSNMLYFTEALETTDAAAASDNNDQQPDMEAIKNGSDNGLSSELPSPEQQTVDTSAIDEINQRASEVFSNMNTSGTSNLSLVDTQFSNLMSSFEDMGFGKNVEIEVPTFDPGYSNDVMTLFQNNFGNLQNQLTLETPTLPEGFNVRNMMTQASMERSAFVDNFRSSDIYTSTLDQISIGGIFDKARQGLEMPSLFSSEYMYNSLSSISSGAKSANAYDISVQKDKIANIEAANQYNADPSSPNSKAASIDVNNKSLFDQECSEVKDWLDDVNPVVGKEKRQVVRVAENGSYFVYNALVSTRKNGVEEYADKSEWEFVGVFSEQEYKKRFGVDGTESANDGIPTAEDVQKKAEEIHKNSSPSDDISEKASDVYKDLITEPAKKKKEQHFKDNKEYLEEHAYDSGMGGAYQDPISGDIMFPSV